jgi:hypothetical protein
MRSKRTALKFLVGKPEGERPLRRFGRRRDDNIKMDLRDIRSDVMQWIDHVQDRDRWRALVNTVIKL